MIQSQLVPIDKITLSEEDRLRFESGQDVEELKESLKAVGQLQPIRLIQGDSPDSWTILNGGRRYAAIRSLNEDGNTPRNLPAGQILAIWGDDDYSDVQKLIAEFDENEHREGFTWREKAEYIKRIHELGESDSDEWTVDMTAAVVRMSKSSVYKYLEITKQDEVFESDRVQGAESFNTAYKQAKIERSRLTRKQMIERGLAIPKPGIDFDPAEVDQQERQVAIIELIPEAQKYIHHRDCRDWLDSLPDESVDAVHWDPPYGGMQEGGTFALHTGIDDSEEYARELMADTFPRLFRVLKDGRWMILWYHPSQYQWIIDTLTSQSSWWVNPYPNTWHKTNRGSDGHEITRYLTNVQEHFLLVAKWNDEEPILNQSHYKNLFQHDLVSRTERRHQMHKPAPLLTKIMSAIAMTGEKVIDPSFGSGSIIEACAAGVMRFAGCEIEEEFYEIGLEIMAEKLHQRKNFGAQFSQEEKI
jgi:DNA modification methylase/ParB-like chromosome segregation protein Spo0J